jgi:hypothetical protein
MVGSKVRLAMAVASVLSMAILIISIIDKV